MRTATGTVKADFFIKKNVKRILQFISLHVMTSDEIKYKV